MPDPAGVLDTGQASAPPAPARAPATAPGAVPQAAPDPVAEAALDPIAEAPDSPAASDPGSSRLGLFLAAGALALSADAISKVLIVADLDPLEPRRLMGGAAYLVLTRNGGAAFSVGPGATILVTLVAVVIVGLLVRVAGRLRSSGWAIALGLILGGALGNLVDRFARSPGFGRGHVVDWISLFADDGHIWPIFNLADAAIVIGGVLGAVLAVRGVELDGHSGHTRDLQARPGPVDRVDSADRVDPADRPDSADPFGSADPAGSNRR